MKKTGLLVSHARDSLQLWLAAFIRNCEPSNRASSYRQCVSSLTFGLEGLNLNRRVRGTTAAYAGKCLSLSLTSGGLEGLNLNRRVRGTTTAYAGKCLSPSVLVY